MGRGDAGRTEELTDENTGRHCGRRIEWRVSQRTIDGLEMR